MPLALSIGMKPMHYDLRIEPDLENSTFEGSVAIQIKVLEWTSSITLNVDKLEIRSATLRDEHGNILPIASTKNNATLQTLEILSEGPFPVNSTIFLQHIFSGTLQTNGNGFHITPANLFAKPIAATNLEPNFARSVFPCFDDPSLKATFSVTIVTPRHLMCLGNMPVKAVTELPARPHIKRAIEFKKSPVMPTYLVAFAIGEFNMIENHGFRIPIRAYAPHDFDIENCRYALDIAARALEIHEKTFQLECGLSKLDLVVIPGMDGGMENWGLVTVASGILVVSPDSCASEKALSATIIAHELAHQWFGNLVTMTTWENFWVKEALSEWADVNAREQMASEEPWEEFVADGLQRALGFDASRFSHAVEPSCGGGKEAYYDGITYQKGHALMRMLAVRLGKDVFLSGVRRYLKKYTFGNATAEDLWEALSLASGLDIRIMMRDWTEKPGYPVINVEEDEESRTINVSQQRFLMNGNETATDETIYSPIFLRISTPNGIMKEILEDKTKTIKVPLSSNYKLNANQTSYIRVAYPSTHLLKLSKEILTTVPSPLDRIGLLSDLSALTFSCHPSTSPSVLLAFLLSLSSDPNFFVWKTIISTLNTITKNLLFEEKHLQHAFQEYRKCLVKKCLYIKGTFRKEDDLNEMRFKAMMFGNSGGDEKVLEAAREMWRGFVGEEKGINPNIRTEVFEVVLREGGKKEFNDLLSLLPSTTTPLRKNILSSLGYSQSSSCISRTIKVAFSPTSVSNNETMIILRPLTTHTKGFYALFKFITRGKWKSFKGLGFDKIAPVGQLLLDTVTRREWVDLAKKYLRGFEVEEFKNEVEMCFEGIEARSKWLGRDKEGMLKWLKENGYWKGKEKSGVKKVLAKLGCLK